MPKRAFVLLILGFAVFAAFVGLRLLSVLYTDYLWFSSLGFHDVFIIIIRTKTLALFAFGSVFALICGFSIVAARRYGQPTRIMALEVIIDGDVPTPPDHSLRQRYAWIGIVALLSFFMGVAGTSAWSVVLKYINPTSFDLTDPIFGRDISFYVFSLPLYNFLQGWLISAIIVTGIATVVSYHQDRAIRFDDKRWITDPACASTRLDSRCYFRSFARVGILVKEIRVALLISQRSVFWRGLYRSQYPDLGLLSDAFGAACSRGVAFLQCARSHMEDSRIWRGGLSRRAHCRELVYPYYL